MLLAACVQDFGGDGKQELLLVRTRGKEKGEYSSNYTDMEKVWYLELYGIDGTEVQARQYYEMPDSDLNSYMEGVEEQVGIRTMDGSCYIERYGMCGTKGGLVSGWKQSMKSVSNNEWREVSRSHSKPMVANIGEGLNFRRHKQ